jgi:hypothetical protein
VRGSISYIPDCSFESATMAKRGNLTQFSDVATIIIGMS